MPGFFDRVKEGAQKAAAEAERLSRLTQAQVELRGIVKQHDEALEALGRAAMALFDQGGLPQPELQAACAAVIAVREKVAAQEARIAELQGEAKPPAPPEPAASPEPAVAAPPPPEAEPVCANCGARIAPGSRFCGECGTPVAPTPI